MNSSVTPGHQRDQGSDEATWRDELANLLGPTTFPCTSQDAIVNLLRARAPSRLLWRLNAAPRDLRFVSLDSLIASIDAHSSRHPQHLDEGSPIDEQDRHDILVQQIIDDLARSSRGRQQEQVVAELAIRLAEENLPAKPRPWLDAVAAEAIIGNAYVVTPLTALVCDVPKLDVDRSGKTIK